MTVDPAQRRWHDAEGRDLKRWELTRAYMHPRYRGQNYSLFMAEMVMALAKKNHARSVVAYPRHVAMLVTLPGIVMLASRVHWANAPLPILVTLAGTT